MDPKENFEITKLKSYQRKQKRAQVEHLTELPEKSKEQGNKKRK